MGSQYLLHVLHGLILFYSIIPTFISSYFIQSNPKRNRNTHTTVLYASSLPKQDARQYPTTLVCRRNHLLSLPVSSFISLFIQSNSPAYGLPSPPQDTLSTIQEASKVLQTLLDNWDKATVDCTYADVPRELLETKNKDLLIEKAATSALFDKSTSVVTCKMNNRIVRDYIGATGKGPLVNIDKKLTSPLLVELIDADYFEQYDAGKEILIDYVGYKDLYIL